MRAKITKLNVDSGAFDALWAHHNGELRDPHQIVSQWQGASEVDPQQLEYSVKGRFWDVLESTGQTLVVTREYEHLVIAMSVQRGIPRLSYLRLPHPSGLAVDERRGVLIIASTRNPNMIFEFAPCQGYVPRDHSPVLKNRDGALLPVRSHYLPGCLYIHDIASISGKLFASAVAMNAVVELPLNGGFKQAWWPSCIDSAKGPLFGRNYLQLNSIAAGKNLEDSFFSASAAKPFARLPGHLNFPVDKLGVIFSGKTREVVATGLTRPHSARLRGKTVWVDNSGYGEVGCIINERFEPVVRLPGWTRGLCWQKNIAFAGSSRVIPRFQHYAPGIDSAKSVSGVHALDLKTGKVLGSLSWHRGNQIFALELTGLLRTGGFPFLVSPDLSQNRTRIQQLFFKGSCWPNYTPKR